MCDCLFGDYAEDPDGPKRPYTTETGNNKDEIFVVSIIWLCSIYYSS